MLFSTLGTKKSTLQTYSWFETQATMEKSGINSLFPFENQNDGEVLAKRSLGYKAIWEAIKEKLKDMMDDESHATWIQPLHAVRSSHDGEITVVLPNMVFFQGINNEFLPHIEQSKLMLGFEDIRLKFVVEGAASVDEIFADNKLSQEASYEVLTPGNSNRQADGETTSSGDYNSNAFSRPISGEMQLNRTYTFDSFVKGDSNQFAFAACMSVAENPGKTYNPLFIYGCTGLGKTHLLHAVGNLVLKNNPNAVVTYTSSERFMNEMIYCLRFNKMFDFRQKYRNCDVFLVDDIQFISGRKATQEEFFHTFNTLYAAKKQIVMTSDLFPRDIPDIEERLKNRFQWGLIADIQPPSIEHRIAILYSKAESLSIRLKHDVAEYIAKHAKKNVRELEGALHRLNAFAALQGEEISLELAMKTFKDVLGEPPKRMTIETIQKVVADHFKLRVADLKSKRRQRAFAHPRQIAMYLSRKLTNSSYPEIGDKFGGKDHTTVMHNVSKIESNLEKDLDLKTHIQSLERHLEQLQ